MNIDVNLQAAYRGLVDKLSQLLEDLGAMLPNVLLVILVLITGWYAAKWVQRGAGRALASTKATPAVRELLTTLLRVLVFTAALFVCLGILQLNKALASLLAGAGVVGLALGFAFQDLAANLISGVGLAVHRDRPFKIGDIVETNDEFGEIQAIDLRTSTLRTQDGKIVVIPNREIFQNKVVNHSVSGCRRVELPCGVSYGDDLEKVKLTVLQALNELPHQTSDPPQPPQVLFSEFGDSSINFVARFWVDYSSEGVFMEAKSAAVLAIKKAFDKDGITIPFPIRTLDFGIVGGEPLRSQLAQRDSKKGAESSTESAN